MTAKLVSVIIPTYDRAYSVMDAIRSVREQTYPAVQIIVVDDGSKDNTASLISELEGVEYIYQENGGQAAARNLGLRHATGEYVASLDSDDIWEPRFLSESIEFLEKNELDFVFSNWKSSDGKETTFDHWNRTGKIQKLGILKQGPNWFVMSPKQLRSIFLSACIAPTSAYVLRRSSFREWNEDVITADDWLLMLDMVISKPCNAAFRLPVTWFKRVFDDNIYDGRDLLEVMENQVYDDRVMEGFFYKHLTFAERRIFRRRRGYNVFCLGRTHWMTRGLSVKVLGCLGRSLVLAPVGVSSFIVERLAVKLRELVTGVVSDSERANI